MTARVRWIGFDMDECIGSVMPLYPFVSYLSGMAEQKSIEKLPNTLLEICNSLYESEQTRNTKILRPSIFHVLEVVYKAFKQKQIQGAFLFSNNGSKELVQFMGFFLNVCIARLFEKENIEQNVFQMVSWAGQKERKPFGYTKNYEAIQLCLKAKGLPQCSSVNDLLFFDDISHDLEQEIPNYIRVKPYPNQTNAKKLIEVFKPLQKIISPQDWSNLAISSQTIRYLYNNNPIIHFPLLMEDDIKHFTKALVKFLYMHTGSSRKRRNNPSKKQTLKYKKLKKKSKEDGSL